SLTAEQSERIRALMQVPVRDGGLVGLALESRPVREYPNPGGAPQTTLASQLLGFMTEDGRGHYGIESYYDDVLAGTPTRFASVTAGLLPIPGAMQVTQDGQPGSDVRLTIDASLQLQLEKELYAAWVADRAKRVSAVILDPDTGEVLAWASVPGYDANRYGAVADETPQLLYDPIASAVYEPGSVMKMVTAAAALESGTVTLDDEVRDSYALRFGTDMVRNADRSSKGVLPFRDAIAYSRNVATARVALRMEGTVARSSERLHEMWTRLGFGQRTGIDLATEGLGLVTDPSEREWEGIDLANRAFGQGVAVTQVQLAVAYAAMANGGYRVIPHLVQRIGDEAQAATTPVRVIENGLATQLHGLLEHVTRRVPWYRAGTQIPGYVVGGKTGTAQIWDAEGQRWLPDRFNFSFCGFVGADRPEAIIVTRIEEAEPTVLGTGNLDLGIESYELFRRIAVDTMTALDVPPLPVPDEPAGQPDDARDATDEAPGAGGG
ncbi:MAG TPA: penicillin-binding protein 2, partial [Candidatus Limnocylindrales bacterium]|nr:penicillin-binding protein 2 [Candidatus Limnocylindrales bacterium]